MSVTEKLNLMMGFHIPRELFPSLFICPKCFHLISEVDVLEHRLNVCRREVMFGLETMFERNGINLSPYKRYPRQQPMGHYEMQFPHYQSPSVSSCLHSSFQNENQAYQNYSMDLQSCHTNQVHQQQNMQQMNGNVLGENHAQINFQFPHSSQQVPEQTTTNQHHIHGTSQQKMIQKKDSSSKSYSQHMNAQYNCNVLNNNLNSHEDHMNISNNVNTHNHTMVLNHTIDHNAQYPVSANTQNNISASNNHIVGTNEKRNDSVNTIEGKKYSTVATTNGTSNLCKTSVDHKIDHEQNRINNNANNVNETAIPLLISENSDTNLPHPMSMLLNYTQVDSTDKQMTDNVNDPFIQKNIAASTNDQKIYDSTVTKEKTSTSKWANCEANSLASAFNPQQECDIDIEKCDNIDNHTSSAPTPNSANKTSLESLSSQQHDHSLDKNLHISVSEVDNLLDVTSSHPPMNDLSPSTDGLDTLLYDDVRSIKSHILSESPPPPPDGPPQGLRNVQDATEYHKPTVLGTNFKGKKHAKLQICRQCDQVFSNRQALIRHIEKRHKNYSLNYSCDTCHRKFNSERTLKHHALTHRTYPCKDCGKIFLKKAKLKRHREEHTKENLMCKVCKKVTGSTQALISHMKSHDRQPQVHECHICSKKFACKRNLDHHSRIHSGVKPFTCENCGKSFRHKSNMTTHNKMCTGKFLFTCIPCCKGFVLKSLYDRHLAEHKGIFAHYCSYCSKGFSKSAELRKHFGSHGIFNAKICSHCNENSNCNETRLNNNKIKSKKRKTSTPCSVCGKFVSSKDFLEDHMAKHEKRREHKCNECDAAFFYRSNLDFHINSIHRKKKPYSCTVCHKNFARKTALNIHMRIHTGEKPFQCSSCGKAFAFSFNYHRHLNCHVVRVSTQ